MFSILLPSVSSGDVVAQYWLAKAKQELPKTSTVLGMRKDCLRIEFFRYSPSLLLQQHKFD